MEDGNGGLRSRKEKNRGTYGLHRYAFLVLVIQRLQIDDRPQSTVSRECKEDIRDIRRYFCRVFFE